MIPMSNTIKTMNRGQFVNKWAPEDKEGEMYEDILSVIEDEKTAQFSSSGVQDVASPALDQSMVQAIKDAYNAGLSDGMNTPMKYGSAHEYAQAIIASEQYKTKTHE